MPQHAKILIADCDISTTQVLKTQLRLDGYRVITGDGQDLIEQSARHQPDLLLLDLSGQSDPPLEMIDDLRKRLSRTGVIVMVDYARQDLAVQALQHGAYAYVTKPFRTIELQHLVQQALSFRNTVEENESLREALTTCSPGFGDLIGNSTSMQNMYSVLEKVAPMDCNVLILGESGTGKELVARALHKRSPRHKLPFVAVNCAALPETLLESELFGHVKGAFTGATRAKKGLFESASGGTLLLDEVGSIPIPVQLRLLRVLQEHEVRPVGSTESVPIDVRILAATNENLESKIADGTFREDLYYRLSVIPIPVPRLKERLDDVPLLASHFIRIFNEREGTNVRLSRRVVTALQCYPWPGNVRELENAVYRAAALCEDDLIRVEDLPDQVTAGATALPESDPSDKRVEEFAGVSLKSYLRDRERAYVRLAVDHFDGDKEKAAQALGVSLATLYRKYNGK